MNKTAQDLAWNCLPAEVKKEVKRQYQIAINAKEYYTECTLEYLFGINNLTSDAEGEDEMLYVSRKEVQEKWQRACEQEGKYSRAYDCPVAREELYYNRGIMSVVDTLFGSKCLPDEVSEVKRTLSEKLSEPKPAEPAEVAVAENTTTTQNPTEPKFRLKDKVVRKNVSTIRTIVGINSVSDDTGTSYYYMTEDSNGNNRMDFVESDLEPYPEPKEEIRKSRTFPERMPSDSSDDSDNSDPHQSRNLSQNIADCDNQFDTILKDGFSKERRLNIAAMAMQGILATGEDYTGGSKFIAMKSLEIANALIAEAEKGGPDD